MRAPCPSMACIRGKVWLRRRRPPALTCARFEGLQLHAACLAAPHQAGGLGTGLLLRMVPGANARPAQKAEHHEEDQRHSAAARQQRCMGRVGGLVSGRAQRMHWMRASPCGELERLAAPQAHRITCPAWRAVLCGAGGRPCIPTQPAAGVPGQAACCKRGRPAAPSFLPVVDIAPSPLPCPC